MAEKVIINKNGEEKEAVIICKFELENGNEYLVYHFADEEVHVSKIVNDDNEIILDNVPIEDEKTVNETIQSMLEGI